MTAPAHCPLPTADQHYILGRKGEGWPGVCSCRDDEALRATVPHLEPGTYWIACAGVEVGTAWTFSEREWEIDCPGWFGAGPGWVIV